MTDESLVSNPEIIGLPAYNPNVDEAKLKDLLADTAEKFQRTRHMMKFITDQLDRRAVVGRYGVREPVNLDEDRNRGFVEVIQGYHTDSMLLHGTVLALDTVCPRADGESWQTYIDTVIEKTDPPETH